ncbi:MAG: AAA family ATPase [Solirubrobacterales bacterium]
MVRSLGATGETSIPAAGLLILTGPSHVGKTSVARAMMEALPPPAAYLSVDDVLERVLLRPPGSIWSQIPLAYELIGEQMEVLLDQGWFVIAESTFTYVSRDAEGDFHGSALARWIEAADARQAPWLLSRLEAPRETILTRARRDGRLDQEIVGATIDLHEETDLPDAHTVDTHSLDPAAAAAQILTRLNRR